MKDVSRRKGKKPFIVNYSDPVTSASRVLIYNECFAVKKPGNETSNGDIKPDIKPNIGRNIEPNPLRLFRCGYRLAPDYISPNFIPSNN
jgi:hypothetical protein